MGGRMPSVPSSAAGKQQSEMQVSESKGEQTNLQHAEFADSLFIEHAICLLNSQV